MGWCASVSPSLCPTTSSTDTENKCVGVIFSITSSVYCSEYTASARCDLPDSRDGMTAVVEITMACVHMCARTRTHTCMHTHALYTL